MTLELCQDEITLIVRRLSMCLVENPRLGLQLENYRNSGVHYQISQ